MSVSRETMTHPERIRDPAPTPTPTVITSTTTDPDGTRTTTVSAYIIDGKQVLSTEPRVMISRRWTP